MDLRYYDMPGQNQAHSYFVGQGILKYKALEPRDYSFFVPNNRIAQRFFPLIFCIEEDEEERHC